MTAIVVGFLSVLWLISVGMVVWGFRLEAIERREHPGRFTKRWDGKIVRRGHEYDNVL